MKSRQEANVDGFLAPTKAFEMQAKQNIRAAAAAASAAELTEEEAARQEEERREQIAAMRRKFKEKNRQILQALVIKNKEIEKKVQLYFPSYTHFLFTHLLTITD